MKLLVAITSKSDALVVVSAMSKEGYQATVVSSYGGFLKKENAVVLSGVDDTRVRNVLEIIKANTSESMVDAPTEKSFGSFKLPPQIKVGGAVVFICGVEQFMRL